MSLDDDTQDLMYEMWDSLLEKEIDPSFKLKSLIALLHVYSALLGIPDEDFTDLSNVIGISYPGPTSDEYAEWIINYYSRR